MKKIRLADVELEVLDQGAGRPILFVHGFPLDHSMWNAQLAALPSGWRAIAPDLRGCGRSQVTPGTVSMEQLADDLAGVLDALEVREPIVYCGLSMGGYVAWQFIKKHAARLRGLVLCDTRSAADTPEAVQSRMKMLNHVLRAGTTYVAEAMMPRLFAPESFQRIGGETERIRRLILSSSPEAIAATLRGIAARPDSTPDLGSIAVPTLVVVGEHDAITSADEMRGVAAAIPGAQFEVIPDAGHMAPMENPPVFNALLAVFLARLPN